MINKPRRYLASALATTLLAGTVIGLLTGCSSDSSDSDSDSYTWYDYTKCEFMPTHEIGDYSMCMTDIIGMTEEGIAIYNHRQNWNILDYPDDASQYDMYPEWIDYYSYDGELISHKNINELDGMDDETFAYSCNVVDNKLSIIAHYYDGKTRYSCKTYNLENLELISDTLLDGFDDFYNPSVENAYYDNEYLILSLHDGNEHYYCLYHNDEFVRSFNDDNLFVSSKSVGSQIYPYDDDRWLVKFYYDDNTLDFAFVNKNTLAVDMIDHEISSQLVTAYTSVEYSTNYGLYYIESDGIKTIDWDTYEKSVLLDYSNTFANLNGNYGMNRIEIFDDKIVYAATDWIQTYFSYTQDDYVYAYVLTPSDNDPRATRTEIKLASIEMPSKFLYSAISEFNITNDEYYITLDTRYQLDMVMPDYFSAEEYDAARLEALNTICDTLAIDLIAGDGPDIIINAAAYDRLSNSGYLMDLSEYAAGLSPDLYFTSILDAARSDGNLYQLPLGFVIQAVVTDELEDNSYGEGLSYEEYETLYSGLCNGNDPIDYGRDEYMIALFNCMSDLFIQDGHANLKNQEFYDLANYINDNIPEQGRSLSYETMWERGEDSHARYSEYTFVRLVSDYSSTVYDVSLMGAPSSDGRGPLARIHSSIAISSTSNNVDGCYEFIDYLLSDNYQRSITYWGEIPLNRAQYTAMLDGAINDYNTFMSCELREFSEEELISFGTDPSMLTNTGFEWFTDTIENIDHIYTSDTTIALIIREEMPAFYEGQKTLDEVISIMENRINLCLEERG